MSTIGRLSHMFSQQWPRDATEYSIRTVSFQEVSFAFIGWVLVRFNVSVIGKAKQRERPYSESSSSRHKINLARVRRLHSIHSNIPDLLGELSVTSSSCMLGTIQSPYIRSRSESESS